MSTKKRSSGDDEQTQQTQAKKTTQRAAKPGVAAARPARKTPRIHASHADASMPKLRRTRPSEPAEDTATADRITPSLKVTRTAGLRKSPLAGPKRTATRRGTAFASAHAPSHAARELALALAGAAIDKKAIGIEILDVTGKVDYADFLVVMTGRSDRHVHAIATGIEEAMQKSKLAPLSMEGLSGATWVLIDFGDVVVHVFQEEARAVYDIEGLWIDASRVPVPAQDAAAKVVADKGMAG